MMKSPTSLIRFRNAVGVVLALSAVFAVVISAVTFTQDRALRAGSADGNPHRGRRDRRRRHERGIHGYLERSC